MSEKINLFWMYPDILNLHGDRGNIQAFEYAAKRMGLEAEVTRVVNPGDAIDFSKADLMVFGPGELKTCRILADALRGRVEELNAWLADGGHIFVTGTSGTVFGGKVERMNGADFEGLGLLNVTAKERRMILGNDLHVELANGMEVMGSQIQMAEYTVDPEQALGKVLYGHGNRNTGDEGAQKGNLIWTNLLGPVMVKNPWWACRILARIADRKGLSYTVPAMEEFDLEYASLKAVKEYLVLKQEKKD